MTTGSPARRLRSRRAFLPLSLALAIASVAISAPRLLQGQTDGAASTPLERIEYRRDGVSRTAVGEVLLAGERVRLRLYSDALASHYEIWVDLADFLGASPLPADEGARIRAERSAAVAARQAEREAARARRAAEKEREAAERSARSAGAASAGGAPRRPKGSSGAAGAVPTGGDAPAAGAAGTTGVPSSLAELDALASSVGVRRQEAAERAAELLAEVAERLRGSRTTLRPLRELAGRLEDAELSLGRIEKSLGGRRDAVARAARESGAGELRGRELAEQIEYVGSQLVRLSSELSRVEETLSLGAGALAAIPREDPRSEEPAAVAATPASARTAERAAPLLEAWGSSPRTAPPARSNAGAIAPSTAAPVLREKTPGETSPQAAGARAEGRASEGEREVAPAAEPAREGGWGLPGALLYPVVALSLYLLWRGARPRSAGSGRGPERPERAPEGSSGRSPPPRSAPARR